MNTSHAFPNSYDLDYDLAEQKEASREEAREKIIEAFCDGKKVSFGSGSTWTVDDALCHWLVVPDEAVDKFINEQVAL